MVVPFELMPRVLHSIVLHVLKQRHSLSGI